MVIRIPQESPEPSSERRTFKERFCAERRCAADQYDRLMLRECLYPHARFLEPLLRRVRPCIFEPDIRFIQFLGQARGLREARAEVAAFEDANQMPGLKLRALLRLRVSGRKACRLAMRLMKEVKRLEA